MGPTLIALLLAAQAFGVEVGATIPLSARTPYWPLQPPGEYALSVEGAVGIGSEPGLRIGLLGGNEIAGSDYTLHHGTFIGVSYPWGLLLEQRLGNRTLGIMLYQRARFLGRSSYELGIRWRWFAAYARASDQGLEPGLSLRIGP